MDNEHTASYAVRPCCCNHVPISACITAKGCHRLTTVVKGSSRVGAVAQDVRRDTANAVHKTALAAIAELAAEAARRKQAEQKLSEVSIFAYSSLNVHAQTASNDSICGLQSWSACSVYC